MRVNTTVADKRKELRRWESVWQCKLNTFYSHELNKSNAPEEYE